MPKLCPEDCQTIEEEAEIEGGEETAVPDEAIESGGELTIEQIQEAESLEEKKQLVLTHFNELKDLINENIEKLPGILLTLFGDTRANVYVGDFALVGIVSEDGLIAELQLDGISEPDLTVTISEKTLEQMVNKEVTIEEALNTGLISYEAVGILNKAKFGLGVAGAKAYSKIKGKSGKSSSGKSGKTAQETSSPASSKQPKQQSAAQSAGEGKRSLRKGK